MNQIQHSGNSRRKGAANTLRPSSLAAAVRTAVMASSIALMGVGAVQAQSCDPANVTCAPNQGSNTVHDLTVISAASQPSAVSTAALATDSAAITAAPSSVRIVNNGNIVKNRAGQVLGIDASLDDAIVTVVNNGSIDVTSSDGDLADGIFSAGARTDVTNNGSIRASGYSWIAGIENQSSDSARIRNNGDITTSQSVTDNPGILFSHSYGIFSKNQGNGGSVVENRGNITNNSNLYSTGIHAYDGGTGGLRVTNAGDVSVLSSESGATDGPTVKAMATGIFAVTNAPGANVVLNNSGDVQVRSKYRGSTGIAVSAYGDGAKATVTNSGSISADGMYAGLGAKYAGTALNVLAGGDVSINNTADGKIYGKGEGGATAVQAFSSGGNIRITNAGLIDATAKKYGASAVYAKADTGRVDFTNTGTVIGNTTGQALGVALQGASGATGTNSGLIDLAQPGTANTGSSIGLIAISSGADAIARNTAAGTIKVITSSGTSAALGSALRARADVGNATVTNAGTLEVHTPASGGDGTLTGAAAVAGANGNATATNTGTINVGGADLTHLGLVAGGIANVGAVGLQVQTTAGIAKATNQGALVLDASSSKGAATPDVVGILGTSQSGAVALTNSGTINATARSTATDGVTLGPVGLDGSSGTGAVTLLNSGSIHLDGLTTTGARASGKGGAVNLRNDGSIVANSSAGDATGLSGSINGGSLALRNSRDITANTIGGTAYGILGTVDGGTVSVLNAGNLTASSASGDAYGVLIRGSGPASIDNTGSIVAQTAIQGSDGNNTITNRGSLFGAVITGAGNDTITNATGAMWNLTGSSANFGAGDDVLRNQGTLILGGSLLAFGAGNNSLTNTGTIKVAGNNTVQLGGGSAAVFTNNGLLDFVNGKAGDTLTIAGNFAGKGNINMDVNLRAGKGDSLYISGQTAAGTQQKLNIALLDGLPTAQTVSKPLQLVQVAGSADPKAFVAGQVLGVSPADFLKLSMSVDVAKEPSGNGGNYLLSITPKVAGLNAAGTLASSAALGVDSLLASTSGNWRDRTAMIQASSALPGLKGVTPWVRGFSDTGGMSPSYAMGSFGQAQSSSLNQDNMGSEIGVNLDGGHGLSFGASVAKSEAKQYLANGYGMDTLRGASVGMYATWHAQNGVYVDASLRGMKFDAYMDTVAGRQQSRGNANMLNLETGRTWTLRNGLNLEPQLQYTATNVSGMRVQGYQAQFETDTSNWQRGRLGLQMWKSYRGVSGWNVTPYGQLSAVHTFDGALGYNVNRDFYGQLNSEGTNALVKLGLTANKGRFAFGSALNWQSGQTIDSGLGAQAKLSYAW